MVYSALGSFMVEATLPRHSPSSVSSVVSLKLLIFSEARQVCLGGLFFEQISVAQPAIGFTSTHWRYAWPKATLTALVP